MKDQRPIATVEARWRQPVLVVGVLVVLFVLLEIVFQRELADRWIWINLADVVIFGYCLYLAVRVRRHTTRLGQPSPVSRVESATLVGLLVVGLLTLPASLVWLEALMGRFSISILSKFLLIYLLARVFGKLETAYRVTLGYRTVPLNPTATIVLSFLIAIVIGTVLLSLPEAAAAGRYLAPIDALFTATSATCVTGLIVKDTPTDFSPFGKLVIILLIQAGGLGIMTLSGLFGALLGRRFSISDRLILGETVLSHAPRQPGRTIGGIVMFALVMEAIGAMVLVLRWLALGEPGGRALGLAVFHSISAFCNAGFSLFSDSLTRYVGDPIINLTILALIVIGGLGFPVVLEAYQWLRARGRQRRQQMSLHTKLVLTTSALLIGAGFVLFVNLEAGGVLADQPTAAALWASGFQAITPRTAGFSTVAIGDVRDATLLVLVGLMFIGASPGSTGGGIKTSSFAVLVLLVRSMARGESQARVWGRAIPEAVRHRAFAVFTLMLSAVIMTTFLLTLTERRDFVELLFEAVSALCTVGLSTGVTASLSKLGRLLVTIAMFVGRLGPLTLAMAIRTRVRAATYRYPDEDIMVG